MKETLIAVLAAIAFQVHAGVPRPTPGDFSDAPKDLRGFLLKARKADRITDPLKRCLAFPDYPGNHWPKGLARAECHYQFDPHITLADVRRAVDAGHFKALDRRYARDLARHFSKQHFSPVIHLDFREIYGARKTELKEWNRLTRKWLEHDPHSAFALTARGGYFSAMTWSTRGEQWAGDVPANDMRLASAYAKKAIALYQRAIEVQPKMLPAYIAIFNDASLDADDQNGEYATMQDALVGARRIDPYCKVLANVEMQELEPRWGGSYRAMEAFTRRLKRDSKHRLLLDLDTTWMQDDMADVLMRAKQYKRAYAVLKPTLLQTPWPDAFEDASRIIDSMQVDKPWIRLSYLLEASRFRKGDDYISYSRGMLMIRLTRDFEWSIPSLEASTSQLPDDGSEHLYLGLAYMGTMQLKKANTQLQIAAKQPETRAKALLELVGVSMKTRHPRKARQYINTFIKEYPANAVGLYFRGFVLMQLGDVKDAKASFHTFLRKADRSNIAQIHDLRIAKRMLLSLDQESKQARGTH